MASSLLLPVVTIAAIFHSFHVLKRSRDSSFILSHIPFILSIPSPFSYVFQSNCRETLFSVTSFSVSTYWLSIFVKFGTGILKPFSQTHVRAPAG